MSDNKEQEKQQTKVDIATGLPVVSFKTGKPINSEDEFKEWQDEVNKKISDAINILSSVFKENLVIVTAKGPIYYSKSPLMNLSLLCEMAAEKFRNAVVDTYDTIGFNDNPIEVKIIEDFKKRKIEQLIKEKLESEKGEKNE